jgi:hypothetical protein
MPITLSDLKEFFMWCSIVNLIFFTLAFFCMWRFRTFLYRVHGTMFNLTPALIDPMIYSFLGVYKLLIIVFNIVPWIAFSILFN